MNLIEKIKEYFNFNKTKENNEVENIINYTKELKDENKKLKDTITELQNKINELNKKIDSLETSGFTYYTESKYDLPNKEPIRPNKPKKNKNNTRRNYKKSSLSINKEKEDKKYINEISLIKNNDIPKPGSHDKIEFKNDELIKRKRNRW